MTLTVDVIVFIDIIVLIWYLMNFFERRWYRYVINTIIENNCKMFKDIQDMYRNNGIDLDENVKR